MSIFGLLELSRQRMNSAFWESNYQVCPYCHGKGITRTLESAGVYILRTIEEEGCKNRSSKITVSVPADVAVYLLNQKRKTLVELETKYRLEIVICADNSIKCVSDCKIERVKQIVKEEEKQPKEEIVEHEVVEQNVEHKEMIEEQKDIATDEEREFRGRRGRRGRFDRRRGNRGNYNRFADTEKTSEKQEAVILYDSHDNKVEKAEPKATEDTEKKGKSAWWKKLIKG